MTSTDRLKLALVASAALNLFVLGAGAGLVFGRFDAQRRAPGATHASPSLWAAAQSLRPADRAGFRDLLRARALTLRPDVRAAHEARRKAAGLIAAPVYDPAAVRTALAQARAREIQVRGELDATLLDYVARLPADARAAIADAVVRGRMGAGRAGPDGRDETMTRKDGGAPAVAP